MLWQRSAIGGARLGRTLGGAVFGILFGMDRGYGRFQIFQRQFELVWITLLGPPTKCCLFEGRVEMDTNPVENTILPITLNHKNALFAGHDEGGRT